jgi:hypothetical protein
MIRVHSLNFGRRSRAGDQTQDLDMVGKHTTIEPHLQPHGKGLLNVVPALLTWEKSHFVMGSCSFDTVVDSTCSYFVQDFCIYLPKGYWPVVLCVL